MTDTGAANRRQAAAIAFALAAHGAAFALFYPEVFTVSDEVFYVEQAAAFADGRVQTPAFDLEHGDFRPTRPSPYPPGTSLLMTPLVWAFGPGAAPVVSLLCLFAMVALMARWLSRDGRPPALALVITLFAPAVVLSRNALSDLPSGALTTAALLLFFEGAERATARGRPARWLAAGALAGASALFRETNPLALAPLFAGAVLRRDRSAWALVVGAAVGLGLRPLLVGLLYGTPWFVKDYPSFAWANLPGHLLFHLLVGTVLLPLGIPAALTYRGERWQEVTATTAVFLLVYGCYAYAGAPSGPLKALVLGGRFAIPFAPLWLFALGRCLWPAEGQALGPWPGRGLAAVGARVARQGARPVWVLMAASVAAAAAVHVGMHAFGRHQTALRDQLYATVPVGALILPLAGTEELVTPLYGPQPALPLALAFRPAPLTALARTHDVWIVERRRDDSPSWRALQRVNAQLRARMAGFGRVEAVHVLPSTTSDHLYFWRFTRQLR